ncbi:hypothetical protein DN824_20470 [Stutzerimonas nosocomialis]|uniref:hypothetical protein n=1 Tax=Stutzerimonas nosocomialis TaxID=1056496 RepID=UPI001108F649|nr:hypothetical protein [Stutzerimonas nosocomialis]TLX54860.1 hypothetical protein DN824_20470 [Stutzerimonas nosocomialis]
MNFVNNWSRDITLAAGATALALDLPDGEYRLTISDGSRWEIVGATVTEGQAQLTRGLEGTDEQDWPDGSLIYCSITAGLLEQFAEGGGGGVVIADSAPIDTPAAPGQLYVWNGVAAYLALSNNSPEDWVAFAGQGWGWDYGVGTGSPGFVYDVERAPRKISVTTQGDPLPPGFPSTLRLPAWQSTPRGWELTIQPESMALSLDFSQMAESLELNVLDYETGTTASIAGPVGTLHTSQPVTVRMAELEVFEGGVYASIELRPHRAPTNFFLSSE